MRRCRASADFLKRMMNLVRCLQFSCGSNIMRDSMVVVFTEQQAITARNPDNMKIREEFKAAQHLKQTKENIV